MITMSAKFYFLLLIQISTYSVDNLQVSPVLQQIAEAFKNNEPDKIASFFNTQIELNFDDDKASYGKNQAEILLKEFMKKNPPKGFEYLHQGTAKEGRLYAISKYKTQQHSFNIYILLKQVSGVYKIDTLDFSSEN